MKNLRPLLLLPLAGVELVAGALSFILCLLRPKTAIKTADWIYGHLQNFRWYLGKE